MWKWNFDIFEEKMGVTAISKLGWIWTKCKEIKEIQNETVDISAIIFASRLKSTCIMSSLWCYIIIWTKYRFFKCRFPYFGDQEAFQELWGKEKISGFSLLRPKNFQNSPSNSKWLKYPKISFTSSKMLSYKISHLEEHMVRKNGHKSFKL